MNRSYSVEDRFENKSDKLKYCRDDDLRDEITP